MKPIILLPTVMGLLCLLAGCAATPATADDADAERTVPRGLNPEPYAGAFSGYRPLAESLAGLDLATEAALRRMQLRLGIVPDPDRPRVIRVQDDVARWSVESSIIGGRSVQVIVLPAAPLARGRETLEDTLLEALAHAVLDDQRYRALPLWFRRGAPCWISGRMERMLVLRLLSSDVTPVSADQVLPGFDPLRGEGDALSGAFFIAWLAETFGPELLPDIVRGMSGADSIEEALAAVLPHDPSSLEAGFDTYRVVRVDQFAEDPCVVELLAVRGLPAAERVVRLSGLAARAPHPVIGAAAAEELGLAQYEAEDYAGAAETLARVERDHLPYALHPDRDSFLFAMTFLKRDQEAAAALRFESFLVEFPASPDAPRALFELATVQLHLGRNADATRRFGELSERFPDSVYARKAFVVLGGFEAGRHRYALARSYLERADPDEEALHAMARLDAATADGLPEAAVPTVQQALRDLASPDELTGEAGVAALAGIGPLAEPLVLQAAANPSGRWFCSRAIRGVSGWGLSAATPVLGVMLAKDDGAVVRAAFDALAEMGATAGAVREILDGLPAGSDVAEGVWLTRFAGKTGIPEVAGLIDARDFERRIEAARILAAVDRPEAVRALRVLGDDPSPAVRQAAANALGSHPGLASREALAHALADPAIPVRVEAVDALARIMAFGPIRDTGLGDFAGAVRLAAAAHLLTAGDDRDYPLLVALLAEPGGGVATGVEALLRDRRGPGYEGALVDGLISAPDDGTAMRIVRLMCRRVDRDLGYDPGGSAGERERVAALFVSLLEGS